MITLQLASAIFVIFIQKSSADPIHKATAHFANCTNYKSCISPFGVCDSLTGACQLLSRYQMSPQPRFWSDSSLVQTAFDQYISVVCSEDGLYPSHDCRYFHQCINGTSELRTCDSPGFPFFDPVLERCTSSLTCPSFKCFERFDVRVKLEGQLSSYFAYCLSPQYDSAKNAGLKSRFFPYIVTRCYGKDIFNANSGRCEPRCILEGPLPDTTDCHHYFICSLEDPVNSVFSMARLSCPQGQAFLAREYRCVPEQRVIACTTPHAWPL